MTGVRRFRSFIIIAITFAVILATACIAISFALWSGDAQKVEDAGTTGQFYIEYPLTQQSSTSLDGGAYYLCVDHNGKFGDFYKMKSIGGGKYKLGLEVVDDDVLKIYHGSTHMASVSFTGSDSSSASGLCTMNAAGAFAFELSTGSNTCSVTKTTVKYTQDSTEHEDTLSTFSTADYKTNFKVKYNDDKNLYLYCSYGNNWPLYAHFFYNNGADHDLTNWNSKPSGSVTPKDVPTSGHFDHNYGTDNRLCFVNESGSRKKPNIEYYNNFDSLDYDYYVILTDSNASESFDYNIIPVLRAAPITCSNRRSDDTIVREIHGTTSGTPLYQYTNFICVSRKYAGSLTLAYINFKLSDVVYDTATDPTSSASTCNFASVDDQGVSGFAVQRYATDSSGVINYGGSKQSRIVNNAPDGKAFVSSSIDGVTHAATGELMDYTENGTYLALYFGAGADQYFALEVTITTTKPVSFTLTAWAANADWRNPYAPGQGLGYGYYAGGTFLGVSMWDPRPDAQFEKHHDQDNDNPGQLTLKYSDWATAYTKVPKIINVSREMRFVTDAAHDDAFKLYRLDDPGSGIGTREGGEPTLYFIPEWIQLGFDYTPAGGSLIPAGTKFKPTYDKDLNTVIGMGNAYNIRFVGDVRYKTDDITTNDGDNAGHEGVWAIDIKPAADPTNPGKYIYTKEEYYGTATGAGVVNLNATQRAEKYNGELRYRVLDNWNGIVDTVFISAAGSGSDKATVTLNANAGSSGTVTVDSVAAATRTVEVDIGTGITSATLATYTLTAATGSGYSYPAGTKWYTDANCTTEYTGTAFLGDATLYAGVNVDVTYSYNYTSAPDDGVYDTQTLLKGGKATRPATDPSRTGYTFSKWTVGAAANSAEFAFATAVITEPTTIYAQWQSKYEVTFDVGNDDIGATSTITNWPSNVFVEPTGTQTVAKPTPSPTKSGWWFRGWYTDNTYTTSWKFTGETGAMAITGDTTIYAKWTDITDTSAGDVYLLGSFTDPAWDILRNDAAPGEYLYKATVTTENGEPKYELHGFTLASGMEMKFVRINSDRTAAEFIDNTNINVYVTPSGAGTATVNNSNTNIKITSYTGVTESGSVKDSWSIYRGKNSSKQWYWSFVLETRKQDGTGFLAGTDSPTTAAGDIYIRGTMSGGDYGMSTTWSTKNTENVHTYGNYVVFSNFYLRAKDKFKIVVRNSANNGDTWYGSGTAFADNATVTLYGTGSESNISLASGAGDKAYNIVFNKSTHELSLYPVSAAALTATAKTGNVTVGGAPAASMFDIKLGTDAITSGAIVMGDNIALGANTATVLYRGNVATASYTVDKITFSGNGADTISATQQTALRGTAITLPTVTKAGYTPDGWTSSEGTSRDIAANGTPARTTIGDETFTAKWAPVSYTINVVITPNNIGGSATVKKGGEVVTSANIDDEIVVTPAAVSGYVIGTVTATYNGTLTTTVTNNGDGTYKFNMPAYNVTVTVTYASSVKYTVSYMSETPSGATAAEINLPDDQENISDGTEITLPNTPTIGTTYTGDYTFAGWKLNNTGATIAGGTKVTVDGDKTYYAQWTPVRVVAVGSTQKAVLRFNAYKGTGNTKPEYYATGISLTKDDEISIKDNGTAVQFYVKRASSGVYTYSDVFDSKHASTKAASTASYDIYVTYDTDKLVYLADGKTYNNGLYVNGVYDTAGASSGSGDGLQQEYTFRMLSKDDYIAIRYGGDWKNPATSGSGISAASATEAGTNPLKAYKVTNTSVYGLYYKISNYTLYLSYMTHSSEWNQDYYGLVVNDKIVAYTYKQYDNGAQAPFTYNFQVGDKIQFCHGGTVSNSTKDGGNGAIVYDSTLGTLKCVTAGSRTIYYKMESGKTWIG